MNKVARKGMIGKKPAFGGFFFARLREKQSNAGASSG
jgi:hypothetical protein